VNVSDQAFVAVLKVRFKDVGLRKLERDEYLLEDSVERGMGSVKRLEFDTLPRVGGWDYIYLNDDIQGSEGDM
jgi:hypothetical protein